MPAVLSLRRVVLQHNKPRRRESGLRLGGSTPTILGRFSQHRDGILGPLGPEANQGRRIEPDKFQDDATGGSRVMC
jgi:hypothetical protein